MEDSQPSQLLRDVLCGGAEPGGKSIDTDPSLSDLVIPKIVSPESSHDSARNSGSAPRYHYYGLAQTQSQQHDDCADNEHSQKENFGSSIGSRSTPSNAPSSKSPIKEQTTPGGQLNHTLPRAAGIKVRCCIEHYWLFHLSKGHFSLRRAQRRRQRISPPEPLLPPTA